MLISPPLIADHIDGFDAPEAQTAPHGFYPISKQNRWHGGVHLDPGTSADVLVRAIADGKLIAYRQASKPEYKSYDTDKTQPSDTSFILLKHSTETGDGVKVEFYSLYMHLRNQADFPNSFLNRTRANYVQALRTPTWDTVKVFTEKDAPTIYRKDILGFVGQWTGKHYVHFETFCTSEQLEVFFHDSKTEYQDTNKNGHAELWGDIYYMIPPATAFKAVHPDAAKMQHHKYPAPPLQTGSNTQRLYVRMRYDQGARHVQTWTWDDESNRAVALGGERADADYEYNLYQRATDLCPSCPSAGYELLRFGRVIGADKDKLSASDAVFWENLPFSATQNGYVNLADVEVLKFSDADFPHFMGWEKINEDGKYVPDHGHANVDVFADLIKAVDTNHDGDLTKDEYEAYFKSDPTARQRMRRLICQHSSEWDQRTQATRYEDLTHTGEVFDQYPQNHQPFLDFYAKAAFWADVGLPDKVWYFHPLEFVAHFKKCGWLSQSELTQLVPRKSGVPRPTNAIAWHAAFDRVGGGTISYLDLGKTFRKYGFTSAERQTAFLSQSYIESALLRTVKEYGEGADNPSLPNTKYYAAFYGRGLMQLTWPVLYEAYGKFRSFPNQSDSPYKDPRITATSQHHWGGGPTVDKKGHTHSDMRQWAPRYDPDIVASDGLNACDSAAFFWVWKHFMGHINIDRISDEDFTVATVGQTSVLVNGGGNGYNERQQFAAFIKRYRSDTTDASPTGTLNVTRQRIASHPKQAPTWAEGSGSTQVHVDYTAQRP